MSQLIRSGFKNRRHGTFPWRGGGGPPFSVNFFPLGFREPTVRGGGGYPPFPLRKNPWKIGLKTVFFGQKSPFSAKKFPFSETDRPWRGGGVPPFSVNFFPLTFRKILVRGGPGGGGTPPTESFRAWGFWHLPLRTVHFTNWTTSQAWKGCVLIKCRRLIYHMVGLDYTCDEKIRNTILSYFLKNKTKMNFIFKICLRQKLTIIKTSFNESMSMKQERYQW